MTFTVWHIVVVSALVAVITVVIVTIRTRRKNIKKVAYMMDALEDGELNFSFLDKNKFNRTLNRIRTIFEKQRQAHEQDSWARLIRVLTHEIMNTVSPIASLSDAMARSVHENGHSELDIKAGLETISDSSKNLINFVQTYRHLPRVRHRHDRRQGIYLHRRQGGGCLLFHRREFPLRHHGELQRL